ncbi:MAG: flippase-like domain-containing protein [Planctomycetes bacterium]|nr:flippase-like domain-containing protein [Planctomycetota bacterium]
MSRPKKRLLILVGVLLSMLFLGYSLRGTDFGAIGGALADANWWLCAPMLAAYALYYWIKAIRWRLLLQPMTRTTARAIFKPMMIGFLFNNLLPAHLGELVRMYLGARQLRLRKTQVLATIVLERMFDFLSVVFFLGLVLIVGKDIPASLVSLGYATAAGGLGFLAIAAVYIRWTPGFLGALRALTLFVPRLARLRGLAWLARAREGAFHQLEVGVEGLYALKNPRLLAGVVATSLAQWACMGVSAYLAMRAVRLETRMSAAFVVLAATTFGVTLPAAPGFLGTIQAAFKVALLPYGVSATAAFAASAFFHVPTYLAVTLPGLYLLRRTGYRLRQIQQEAEAAAGEAADDRSD